MLAWKTLSELPLPFVWLFSEFKLIEIYLLGPKADDEIKMRVGTEPDNHTSAMATALRLTAKSTRTDRKDGAHRTDDYFRRFRK